MKKTKLLSLSLVAITLCAVATFQSCTRIAKALNFKLGMQTESVNVTIPVTSGVNGVISVGPTMSRFDVDSFVKAQTSNQLGAANIKTVKLASVVFTLNNPNALNNFQNFESVSASFYSNTNSTPINISIPNNPDEYASSLTLPVDPDQELKSYIGNEFSYTVEGKLRRPTTIELDCTITFTFNIEVAGEEQ